jgi:hypothetical protein
LFCFKVTAGEKLYYDLVLSEMNEMAINGQDSEQETTEDSTGQFESRINHRLSRNSEALSESAPATLSPNTPVATPNTNKDRKLIPILVKPSPIYTNKLLSNSMVKVKPFMLRGSSLVATSTSLNFAASSAMQSQHRGSASNGGRSSSNETSNIDVSEGAHNLAKAKSKGVRFSDQVIILNQLDFLPPVAASQRSESCLRIPAASYTSIMEKKRPVKI